MVVVAFTIIIFKYIIPNNSSFQAKMKEVSIEININNEERVEEQG